MSFKREHKDPLLVKRLTGLYIETLSRLSHEGERSYGFEYEFLPRQPLTPEDMQVLFRFLSEIDLQPRGSTFLSECGISVAFEPGGQIEYCSPPISGKDAERFSTLMAFIAETNLKIKNRLGIDYIGVGYLPGRADVPLCLSADRYLFLHERLSRTGSRGLEMMKGTASIHLHVVIAGLSELLPLFNRLCELSADDLFKMSAERRDIWDHTDPVRCGRPPCCFERLSSPEELIERLIRFALAAEVLGEDVLFEKARDQSFDAFLYHMTTLFTDIRFNLKGPTLELRTLDSMPIDEFRTRWKRFVFLLENV